jgi:alkaline phosphatase
VSARRQAVLAFLALLALPAWASELRARSVILMIGDGMGLAQISAGQLAAGGRLQLERCPVVGLAETRSADSEVTDSAAAATAIASGVKTRNGAVGVDAELRPVPTILELARRAHMGTGLIAACSITDATPAAFAAHQRSRRLGEEIAADLAASGVDVLIGGGRRFFTAREDGRDLTAELSRRGYTLIEDPGRLAAGAMAQRVLALVADVHPPRESQGRGALLATGLETALAVVSRHGRFFVMLEGSQIDWGGHANEIDYVTSELLDFDRTIGQALDYAVRDGHTLVVITADHETGGLSILDGSPERKTVEAGFATKGHTAVMVPVFAYGPGSEAFAGVYDNTAIFARLRAALGL